MKKAFTSIVGAAALSAALLGCMADGELAETSDELAAAAEPTLIPLVVEVFQDPYFKGPRRNVVYDEPYFGTAPECFAGLGFDNKATSVMVRKGPDYDAWKALHGEPYAVIYEHPLYRGRSRALPVGGYGHLGDMQFENIVSSLDIKNVPPGEARDPEFLNPPPMTPLTAVVEAHTSDPNDACDVDYKLTVVRTSGNLKRDFGDLFQDSLVYAAIKKTTQWDGSGLLQFWKDAEFTGPRYETTFGDQFYVYLYEWGLEDEVTSIRRAL